MLLSLKEACDYSAEHGKSKAALPFVPPSVSLPLGSPGTLQACEAAAPTVCRRRGALQEGLPILAVPQGLGKFVLKYGSANKAKKHTPEHFATLK